LKNQKDGTNSPVKFKSVAAICNTTTPMPSPNVTPDLSTTIKQAAKQISTQKSEPVKQTPLIEETKALPDTSAKVA
jgi:hypothetical protein